ncbi:hypothetical protein IW150_001329 [Coemansia sp. RSA 2607]|nr:hypothetical protein IW150_001329 [Coemansia sp. RSA 2607]
MSLKLVPRLLRDHKPIPSFYPSGFTVTVFPPLPSKFQTLPYDIIDRIIQYTLNGVDQAHKQFWCRAYPLFQCCWNWRIAFMQREFAELTIELKRTLPFGLTFSKRSYPANVRIYPIEECVRHITISVVSWKRLSTGETLEWMRASPELARINKTAISSLKIDGFSGDEWNVYFKKETSAAVTRLVELLNYLYDTFPNVKAVSVNYLKWEFMKFVPRADNQVELAFAKLFSGRGAMMYAKFVKDVFATFNPCYFTRLTSLHIETANAHNYFKYAEAWVTKVIRLNAATLERLELCTIFEEMLRGITHSKAGNPIIYPKLKCIKTRVACFRFVHERTKAKAFAMGELPEFKIRHFPALKHINLDGRPYVHRYVAPEGASFQIIE